MPSTIRRARQRALPTTFVKTRNPASQRGFIRCSWWRWGRVELPVQETPDSDVLQAYPMLIKRSRTSIGRHPNRLPLILGTP